jgi:RNA polymerase sigma-70 factor (ECF subfamily)
MHAVKVVAASRGPEPDESRRIESILAGDPDGFGYFVGKYQRRVFAMAFRLLRDRAEAECVAQEAFLRAYQNLGDFRGGAAFETWVTRIAINGCRDRLKRKRIIRYLHQSPEDTAETGVFERAASEDPSPERISASAEIRGRILRALAVLSPRQRTAFVLKHLEERSIPEIALLMGLDSGTVKSHLFRAGRKVRGRLADLRRQR